MSERQEDLAAAQGYYARCHEMLEALAAAAPDNAEALRNLSLSYEEQGGLAARQGDLAAARGHYQRAAGSAGAGRGRPGQRPGKTDLIKNCFRFGSFESKPSAEPLRLAAGLSGSGPLRSAP